MDGVLPGTLMSKHMIFQIAFCVKCFNATAMRTLELFLVLMRPHMHLEAHVLIE